MKNELKNSHFSQEPKKQEKTSSDNWNFSSGANFCSLSRVLWPAVRTGGWKTPLTPNHLAVSAQTEVAWEILDLVMLWINIWPMLKCQEGAQLLVRPVLLVYPAGSKAVFLWQGLGLIFLVWQNLTVSGRAICPFDTFWPQQNMKNR